MSDYDSEFFSEGDWDERGDLVWNEFDWQQYLIRNEREITRFLTHYHQVKDKQDRLDTLAQLMGWNDEDWSSIDDTEEAAAQPDEPDSDDFTPYTAHRHPVFIVTQGLYRSIRVAWERFMAHSGPHVPPAASWELSASTNAGEMNAVMAIHALDVGDFALAVCHLKNALGALNHTLQLVQELQSGNSHAAALFQSEATRMLFDMREVWLRVMSDCRDEFRRDLDQDQE